MVPTLASNRVVFFARQRAPAAGHEFRGESAPRKDGSGVVWQFCYRFSAGWENGRTVDC